jgi:hypothetical protein
MRRRLYRLWLVLRLRYYCRRCGIDPNSITVTIMTDEGDTE